MYVLSAIERLNGEMKTQYEKKEKSKKQPRNLLGGPLTQLPGFVRVLCFWHFHCYLSFYGNCFSNPKFLFNSC